MAGFLCCKVGALMIFKIFGENLPDENLEIIFTVIRTCNFIQHLVATALSLIEIAFSKIAL